ncbi:ABC transporter substrate-binding protein [Anaerobacillus alkaliphilus]|uniref:ABC transporter substrate-binding protein n=1 Tax=Anaerobacillus alkaliphilus TaxID=1548597 RepID=A0A4Q0VM88_9BACI|nr:ABC transporter substrate-binding protein [Anaerobacillus alkaliphilus]RXI96174.1 ABC transporter substrate-binding protein [Anaerobacillus alkaliphilus]
MVMKKTGFIKMFLLSLFVLVVLSACSGNSKDAQTQPTDQGKKETNTTVETPKQGGGTITVTSVREPDTVDVQRTTWVDDANNHLYEPLVRFDFDGKVVPALAESFEVSPDGLVITFTLREGTTYHTGTPVTAEGIKKSFQRFMDSAPTSYMVGPLEEVVVVSDLKFELHFREAFAPFLSNATTAYLAPLDPSVIDELGDDFGTKASAAGILKLAEISRGSFVKYDTFSDFQLGQGYSQNKGAANFDSVVFRFISDDDTRILEFKRGNSQIMLSVPPNYISELENDPQVELARTLANGHTYLGMNNKKPVFQDLRVRQAIALAVDRAPIVDYALEGAAQALFGPLPPTIPGYSQKVEDQAAQMYGRNIEKARQLLAEAGYEQTNNNGIVMKDGKPLSIELWVTSEPTMQRIAQLLQNQLAEAGIEMRISVQEDATIRAQSPEGAHEMLLWTYGWYDADILHSLFGRGISTRVHYQNDALIEILEKARVEVDPNVRMKMYEDAQMIIVEESPWVPLFVRQNVVAYRDIEGFQVHPITGSIIWSDITKK